jgi:hypothetical protein
MERAVSATVIAVLISSEGDMHMLAKRARTIGYSCVVALLTSATFTLAGPVGPAQAATARNGLCEDGEFCLYYNSGLLGSVSDFNASVSNYGPSQPSCYEFRTVNYDGYGQCVWENAASVWNRSNRSVTLYSGTGYSGNWQIFLPGANTNVSPGMKNKNRSHHFN